MKKKEAIVELAVLGILVIVGILGPELFPNILRRMPQMFIMSIAAIGLNIILGFAGMFHFGIGAFVAIGAYAIGILTFRNFPFEIGFWPAVVVGPLITMAAGLMLGAPLMRVSGDYLAIVSLGFAEIVKDTLVNLEVITKGSQGIDPIPSPVLPGVESFTSSPLPWYFFALAMLFLTVRVCKHLTASRFGRAWRAVRDDELAAGCTGLNPVKAKMSALAVGCFFAGLAGVLYASNLRTTAQPQNYDFNMSAMLIVMVILGGLGSIYGSILGVVILQSFDALAATFSDFIKEKYPEVADKSIFLDPTNWKWFLFGLALVLIVRFKPHGILPEKHGGVEPVKK